MRYLFKKRSRRALAAALDIIGAALFVFSKNAQRKPLKDSPHFLLVRLDHLGDILFAAAVPQALKENFSGCRVTFLTSGAGAALLENNPFVDEVLVYDAPWFLRPHMARGSGSRNSYGNVARRLKKMKIDSALSLRGDLRENLLIFLAGVKERIGYGVTGGGFFLTRELKYRWGVHERQHTLDILNYLGISNQSLKSRVYFSTNEEKAFVNKMREWGLSEQGWKVGIQLEAGAESKEWPQENREKFISLCAEKFPKQPLIFIGASENWKDWLFNFLKKNPSLAWKNLIGQTSLRELLWVIRQCRFFVGADSGPTHVAASYGIPTLFLYSGTNRFEEWRSLEENAEFLRNIVPCSPCHEMHCPVQGHPCMAGIAAVSVVQWMEQKSHDFPKS